MYWIDLDGQRYILDRASEADLPELVTLLMDDVLGAGRESANVDTYVQAFRDIDADPRHYLAAVRGPDGDLVATMQLTLIPGLARSGATRLQIEAVRVASSARGSGLGAELFEWAHSFGRRHGATVAQLTSDASRGDAHRFYEALGYRPGHVGFKRPL